MFTGIIQQLGKVISSTPRTLSIQLLLDRAKTGESIAVNGVCLTLKKYDERNHIGCFDIMAETVSRTNLGKLKAGEAVNIERALKLGDRIGGHFISGHIDETGKIVRIIKTPQAVIYEIRVTKKNMAYITPKGSIAVDGVSLTVVDRSADSFTVSLLPLTIKESTLGIRKAGDGVNIEYDQMVKNTLNILEEKFRNPGHITLKYLKEKGF